jgi:hypothetical protein
VVDVPRAHRGFGQLGVGLGGGFVGLAQGGDLLAQAVEFLLGGEGGEPLLAELAIALGELVGEGLQLLAALGLLGGGGCGSRP